ncbi:hypothetical protein JL720_9215 [Aureococcus anophagefferens]|nr:hypothetical protein JL720_9215 [Aureococcus anophagefferens]
MAASPAGLLLGRRDGKRYGTMPGERNYYSASHGLVLVAGLVLGAVLGPAARLAAGSAATLLAALPGGPDVAAQWTSSSSSSPRTSSGTWPGTQRVFSVFNRGLQGPTRRVALGDVVEVRVTNNRPSGLTLHHHGIHQVGTPYNDGASMVTQAPVAPGGSMAYRFVAEPAGTHWYHGHAGTDYGDGLRGLFVVEDPDDPYAAYPDDVAVMVADVYATQTTYEYVLKFNYNPLNKEVGYDAQANPSVGTLLNGLADFRAAAPRQAVRALLCGAADRQYVASFADGRPMVVVAVQGAYVKPVAATKLRLRPGERYDVIVDFSRDAEGAEVGRTVSFNRQRNVRRRARARRAPMVAAPAAGTDHQWGDEDLDLLFPAKFRLDTRFNPSPPARAADVTLPAAITAAYPTTSKDDQPKNYFAPPEADYAQSRHTFWTLSNTSYADASTPLYVSKGRYGVERDAHYGTNVVDVPLGAVVDIVVVNNGLGSAPVQHPLHLHGYRFWVVDHGPLPYPENDAAAPRYNLDDPPYVDTFPVDTGFYAVLRFVADNPGMWHFHCHYLIHMVNGLSLTYGGYACGAAADVAASPGSNTNS